MVVDDDPVVELEAAAVEEVDVRLDTHADDGEERLDRATRCGADARQHEPVRVEFLDLLSLQELDALFAVELRDLVGELGRRERRHEPVAPLDDRHLQADHAQRRCDFRSDETAADDDGLACLRRFLLHRHGVGERSVRVHRGQVGSRDCEHSRPCAARDHERLVRNRLAARDPNGVGAGVDRLDGGFEAQLDGEVVVLLGRVDECVLRLHLAPENAFRERRPVVGRLVVR